MGNQPADKPQAHSSPKLILRLRSRDIILHYGFKMKVAISDLDLFPHELEGLRLWDVDIVLARYVILESERFKNKDVLVLKAGVGIAAIALGKWTDAKTITITDSREEVFRNGVKNCVNNGVMNVGSFRLCPDELRKFSGRYDHILCPDLMAVGFLPQQINEIFRMILREGGEAALIMPERKEQAKKLLEAVDRNCFKITNLILTAEEYQTSPLFNRLEAEKEFPEIGKVNYYAIIFTKLPSSNAKPQQQGQPEKPKQEEEEGDGKELQKEEKQEKQKEEKEEQAEQSEQGEKGAKEQAAE